MANEKSYLRQLPEGIPETISCPLCGTVINMFQGKTVPYGQCSYCRARVLTNACTAELVVLAKEKSHTKPDTEKPTEPEVDPKRKSKSRWYLDGYSEGEFAADVQLSEPSEFPSLLEAFGEERLGEVVGEIREHQVQMAGDISYDVGRPGGPTERQYELWESGFTDGFIETVTRHLKVPLKIDWRKVPLTAPIIGINEQYWSGGYLITWEDKEADEAKKALEERVRRLPKEIPKEEIPAPPSQASSPSPPPEVLSKVKDRDKSKGGENDPWEGWDGTKK